MRRAAVLAIAVIITLGVVIVLGTPNPVRTRILEHDYGSAVGRVSHVQVAVRMIRDHPFFGHGMNNYVEAARAYDAAYAVLREVMASRDEEVFEINPETLQQLRWSPPDWIVLPGGNLGNTSAFGKALWEAKDLGLISRLPRLAVIQAAGANPLYQAFRSGFRQFRPVAADFLNMKVKLG